MKFASKNRSTAACRPCCNCPGQKAPANVVTANTHAKTKIANPTVVWDYKEHIHPDIAQPIPDPNKKPTPPTPPFDFDKITKEDRSSRVNRGRLNAMVLG